MTDVIIRGWNHSDAIRSDRSAGDRNRHRQKVRQAIRDNIADIVAEESLIGISKNHVIKVPIWGVKEYRFIYGPNLPGVAQGTGKSEPGDVLEQSVIGKGTAGQAGDRRGIDYYETEITIEELVDIMFEDLALPNQERKELSQIEVQGKRKYSGYRRKDIRVRLSLPRTAIERIRRLQAAKLSIRKLEKEVRQLETQNSPNIKLLIQKKKRLEELGRIQEGGRFPFLKDDLRFHHRKEISRKESNAVVICIMDSSGSMDTVKKYLARSFFFLLYRFVSTKYSKVEVVFIAHDTEAREVNEDEFFHKGESGGTMISSGYNKALEIIQERYHSSLWNIYGFHCSDGDNYSSDNESALEAAKKMCQICKLFGYGEIRPNALLFQRNSMHKLFSESINADNYQSIILEKKEDIWPRFRDLLQCEQTMTMLP